MKKSFIKSVLAVGMAVSMTASMAGCALEDYADKSEEAKQQAEKLEEEQQAIADAINSAINGTNNDDNNGSVSSDSSDGSDSSKEEAGETVFSVNLDSMDVNGNAVTTEELVGDAKIVMINFWEPWCGPCVGELDYIQAVYAKYSDAGLAVIGVYSSTDMNQEVLDLMDSHGITYPVIQATAAMTPYMSEYVPTTVFFDADGNMIEDGQYIGAREYDDWCAIVEKALESVE